MDKAAGQKRIVKSLYPPIEPFDQRVLPVGDGHHVYLEQCGRVDGVPIIVFHGGPGGGCSPTMRRYFDPNYYRIILFDQRGCGRSRPNAEVNHNTTWHLMADIEHIRNLLKIDSWMIFGGSWGSTLALIYAQKYPQLIRHLILRGIFLGTQAELDWFYGGGAARFWPDAWSKFCNIIPFAERHDLITAYASRLFCGDVQIEKRFGQAWAGWENALASINSNGITAASPPQYARAFSRLENHYFLNKLFLTPEQEILKNMSSLLDTTGHIVQGRYDMICPPQTAWSLAQQWPKARLQIVGNAGHALSDGPISEELVKIMDGLRD
ncbi:prolyl aminopeptidase [bacterium]|nr:prolyl aminopeptidase [bacterium]